jgi:hypothetical protein
MEQRSFTWGNALKVDGKGEDAKPLTVNQRFFNLAEMCAPIRVPHPFEKEKSKPLRLDELAIHYEATVRSLEAQLLAMAEKVAQNQTRLLHHQATCILLQYEQEKSFRSRE